MRIVPGMAGVCLLVMASQALGSGHGAKKPAAHGAAKKSAPAHGKKDAHAKKDPHGKPAHGNTGGHDAAPSSSSHVSDVEQILALIAGKEKRHDPNAYVEFDLGEYRVSHGDSAGESILLLKLHVYGVLHANDLAKFEGSLLGRELRLRDAVLSVIHRAPQEKLNEPALESVKEELVAAMNRVLQSGFVRDVAFSEFSMERR